MQKHILIADDDDDDLEIFMEAARNSDLPIRVTPVNSCKAIFDHIGTGDLPHMIIIDGVLSPNSVYDNILALKEDQRLEGIPLIVLSGSDQALIKTTCYAAGINLYLQKQTSFSATTEIIKRLYHIDWSSTTTLTAREFNELPLPSFA